MGFCFDEGFLFVIIKKKEECYFDLDIKTFIIWTFLLIHDVFIDN